MFRLAVLFCFVTFLSINVCAQNLGELQIQKEIEDRGLNEEEVYQALKAKGIDVDQLDVNDPETILKHEKTIREVIFELEQSKKIEKEVENDGTTTSELLPNEDSKIDELIPDNTEQEATLEEAISEKLSEIENADIPNVNIYGHHLFKDKAISFYRATNEASVPDSYKLGPGDIVSVSIWGDTEENFVLEVSKEGFIKPDRISRIYVSGLTISAAKELIRKRLRNYYYFQPSQMDLNLITARTITVHIVGEVFNQGSFTISAVNTAINALVVAGGPTEIGSVRNIKLLRSGEEKTIDLYEYLKNPQVNENFYLQENDYISVPISKKVVNISGAVKRPRRYELKPNENLNELIEFAGGLRVDAFIKNLQIERFVEGERIIQDVNYSKLKKIGEDFELLEGDAINIGTISEEIENYVVIEGAVENEGRFELKEGMELLDLISLAELKENALTDTVFIIRFNEDLKTKDYLKVNLSAVLQNSEDQSNIELVKGDVIKVYTKARYKDVFSVIIEGGVRFPGSFTLDSGEDLKINDLIFLAGGLQREASNIAYIFRENIEESGVQYNYINLERALNSPLSEENVLLKPNDRIRVFNKNFFYEESYILVDGAVKNPGELLYDPSLTIRSAILLSGGLKREAAPYKIDVFRINFDSQKRTHTQVANIRINENMEVEGAKDFKIEPFDQIIVRKVPEFELQQNITVSGEVKFPGLYTLVKENTRISDIIDMSGGLTREAYIEGATLIRSEEGTGAVVIDLEKALKRRNKYEDIILKKGDVINIPKRNTIVSIAGATKAFELYDQKYVEKGQINVVFEGEKNAKYYVDKFAGGFADDADKSALTVIHRNGKIDRTKRFLFWRMYPDVKEGSSITVPRKKKKLDREGKEKENKDIDWGEVMADSIAQATAILSLVLLLRNLD